MRALDVGAGARVTKRIHVEPRLRVDDGAADQPLSSGIAGSAIAHGSRR
jgi:hypothetical protein